uniref:Uncharacterized protein n=1 Tax=Arundo donax TaxID=35708 RepID=A0A0A9ACG1_ARUDO
MARAHVHHFVAARSCIPKVARGQSVFRFGNSELVLMNVLENTGLWRTRF